MIYFRNQRKNKKKKPTKPLIFNQWQDNMTFMKHKQFTRGECVEMNNRMERKRTVLYGK